MKCQILFTGKNKKNISKCRLLKILPRVLSVKEVVVYSVCTCGTVNFIDIGVYKTTLIKIFQHTWYVLPCRYNTKLLTYTVSPVTLHSRLCCAPCIQNVSNCIFDNQFSMFVTPGDSIFLNKFGRKFNFNGIQKNQNNSEWNYELKTCRMPRYYDSCFSLAYNNAK